MGVTAQQIKLGAVMCCDKIFTSALHAVVLPTINCNIMLYDYTYWYHIQYNLSVSTYYLFLPPSSNLCIAVFRFEGDGDFNFSYLCPWMTGAWGYQANRCWLGNPSLPGSQPHEQQAKGYRIQRSFMT